MVRRKCGQVDGQINGQMNIYDFLQKAAEPQELKCGQYVEQIGERVKFDEIEENKYYIADYSTFGHKWYKVIFTKWKKNDAVGYVDSEKGILKDWSWGNNFSCQTRRLYVDAEEDKEKQLANTHGWWYRVP